MILAVVPARGGSRGLPRKNLRLLAGLPLVGHALRLAERCPSVELTVVSTDDDEIAGTAAELGGAVLRRPDDLAADDTPMWPVLRHALDELDPDGSRFAYLVLVDPTSPLRLPADVAGTLALLQSRADADGAVTVSEPHFSVIWQSVVEDGDGFLDHLVAGGEAYGRRQDVPRTLVINGGVYVWRTEFVRREPTSWLLGKTLGFETPELRARTIDTEDDLRLCEALLDTGVVSLPWLTPET